MRELNLDTQRQNFWTEAIIKEKTVRLDWLTKYERQTYDSLKKQVINNLEESQDETPVAPKNPSSNSKTAGRRKANVPKGCQNFLQEVSTIGSSIEGTSSDVIGQRAMEIPNNEQRHVKSNFNNDKLNMTLVVPTSDDHLQGPNEASEEQNSNQEQEQDLVNVMKPVESSTRKMLYDGFSKEGKGRYQYLQKRTIENKPEQKYDYPHISQWEYGWKQDEQVELRPPRHGRSRVVKDTFFRTRGVFGPQ